MTKTLDAYLAEAQAEFEHWTKLEQEAYDAGDMETANNLYSQVIHFSSMVAYYKDLLKAFKDVR